jgi:hypothetical protein
MREKCSGSEMVVGKPGNDHSNWPISALCSAAELPPVVMLNGSFCRRCRRHLALSVRPLSCRL